MTYVKPASPVAHRRPRHYPAFAWTVLILTLVTTAVALAGGERAATSAPSAVYAPAAAGRLQIAVVPAPAVAGLGSAPAPAAGPLVGPGGLCLDASVRLRRCTGAATQAWTTPADGTLRTAGGCLDASMRLRPCSGAAGQQWDTVGGALVTRPSKQCLAARGSRPYTTRCTETKHQRWQLPPR